MAVFDPKTSKIKMVILTPNKLSNSVWWSPINQNKRSNESIIKGMMSRFRKNELYKTAQIIQFYQNGMLVYALKIK